MKALKDKAKKAVKAVKKAAKKTADFISMTAKTWKADVTQVLESTMWIFEKAHANVVERLVTTDADTKGGAVKTGTIMLRSARGTVARDVEFAANGAMRILIYSAGGIRSGWFKESDVLIGGGKIEYFASAEALAKTFNVFQLRKNASSGSSYLAGMENDLSKFVYSASVRKVNGKLIAWHEEDRRNAHSAHEVSATEREAARSAVLNGASKRTIKARTSAELVAVK